MLVGVSNVCPDCGLELGEGQGKACPRCGLRLDEGLKDVKVMDARDVYNPYTADYDSMCAKIEGGSALESATKAYVSDMENKADCGDAMAQHFLATRIYDEKMSGATVLDLLKASSRAGNHLAELSLANRYARGTFAEPDLAAATRLYRKSAERGNPVSMVSLGNCFMRGQCVKKDAKKAIAWYERALKGGLVDAAKALIAVYSSDEAVPHDLALANKYRRLAAEKGDNDSRYALFEALISGTGVERDEVEAFMWCRLAADGGHVVAQETLAECYDCGRGVRQNRDEAVRWYEKAAACGSCHAMLALAVRYCLGVGCAKNYGRAYYLAMTALEKGYDEALWQMSHCLRNGYGVKQDVKKADRCLAQALDKGVMSVWNVRTPEIAATEFGVRMQWAENDPGRMMTVHFWLRECKREDLALKSLERAVELGSAEGMWCLGVCAQNGMLGVAKDERRAFDLFKQAADKGNMQGKYRLGVAYFEGIGVNRDMGLAAGLIREAAENGVVDAQNRYSQLLFNGTGVPKDEKLAVCHLRKAAEGRNVRAALDLGLRMLKGDLVTKDIPKGVEWIEFAGRNGVSKAWAILGRFFAVSDSVGIDYKRAYDYMLLGTKAGNGTACNDLSTLVARGWGCPKDEARSAQLLDKAIGLGNLPALCRKGDACRDGGKPDKAVECYERAAKAGSADGKYALAVMYWRGEGVRRDVDKAVQLANEAVQAGVEDVEGLVSKASEANGVAAAASASMPQMRKTGVSGASIVKWVCIGVVALTVIRFVLDLLGILK